MPAKGQQPSSAALSDLAAPAAPPPVDFVSEEDVRVAISKGEKIYVGPCAIITPSARDLGDPREIFVTAK